MAAENSLKFIKQSNGNVLLLKKDNNEFIASFIPSSTIKRSKDNSNFFEVMTTSLDYRSIDINECTPVMTASNCDEFLIELSEKFFFLNKKPILFVPIGQFLVFKTNINDPDELLAGMPVKGIVENTLIEGIYLGGNKELKASFEIFTKIEL